MAKSENANPQAPPPQILGSLEPEQLAKAKHLFPRRSLKGKEVVLVWCLRFYLLFMVGVVIYQIWTGWK